MAYATMHVEDPPPQSAVAAAAAAYCGQRAVPNTKRCHERLIVQNTCHCLGCACTFRVNFLLSICWMSTRQLPSLALIRGSNRETADLYSVRSIFASDCDQLLLLLQIVVGSVPDTERCHFLRDSLSDYKTVVIVWDTST